ncbi:MAG: endonuclease/exonuclease/phosphatase family protein [Planctomycetota bacterium]
MFFRRKPVPQRTRLEPLPGAIWQRAAFEGQPAPQAATARTTRGTMLLLTPLRGLGRAAGAGAMAFATSALAAGARQMRAASRPATSTLKVMSYNVRYGSDQPPHAWPERRAMVSACLRSVRADVIATQEAKYSQLRDLEADLPEYRWIGLGRDGGSHGEFMAVFYRPRLLLPLEFDHFWLSDTPEVIGSATWGNTSRRMVTWVRFRDRRTGHEFYFVNTHFDIKVPQAREWSSRLVLERVGGFEAGVPVILAGDFNSIAGASLAYEILVAPEAFVDTWSTAVRRSGEGLGTYNDFGELPRDGKRIDWILCRGPVRVERAEIVTFAPDGQFPSDHLPVVAELVFQKP